MKLYSALYGDWHPLEGMTELFDDLRIADTPDHLDAPGVLVVHGGADISPSLYNKAKSKRTWANETPSPRDTAEWELMKEAVKRDIPIFGICRGAQMLCALAGGFLVQDVTGHSGHHEVVTRDGTRFTTNSIHHQMMYPFDVEHEMIAHTEEPLSKHYLDVDNNINVKVEPEFVYFPQLKGIAIQWHPEMMNGNNPANLYVKEFVRNVLRTSRT